MYFGIPEIIKHSEDGNDIWVYPKVEIRFISRSLKNLGVEDFKKRCDFIVSFDSNKVISSYIFLGFDGKEIELPLGNELRLARNNGLELEFINT